MKKIFSLLLTLSLISPLFAERIGNLQIDFPPSTYEWKLLKEVFKDDKGLFSIWTHREGDALEIFFSICGYTDGDMDERPLQNDLDSLTAVFPNYRLSVSNILETEIEGFYEWEFHDGMQDLLHGYVRKFAAGKESFLIGYLSTALETECSRILWTDALTRISHTGQRKGG